LTPSGREQASVLWLAAANNDLEAPDAMGFHGTIVIMGDTFFFLQHFRFLTVVIVSLPFHDLLKW